jgi:lipopolysaccharide transport system permease protein
MIVYRDIKVRYKQSVMGFFWAILMPILIVMSGVVVRYAYALVAHAPLRGSDVASVAIRSVPWACIVSCMRFSTGSLSANWSLVTKIYFPKEIFPLASVLACLFDFFIASSALVILLFFMKIGWSVYLLWVPAFVATIVLFSMGMGMLISAASLFFRDVRYLVEIFLTFGIFFTPVFYDVRMLGDRGKWIMLNPIAPMLDGLNACIANHQTPNLPWCLYSLVFTIVVSVSGYVLFKHLEPAFAESI